MNQHLRKLVRFTSNSAKENWRYESKLQRKRVHRLLLGDMYQDRDHPIFNFLFTYFFFNHKILYQYSAGLGQSLTGVFPGTLFLFRIAPFFHVCIEDDECQMIFSDLSTHTNLDNVYTPYPWACNRTHEQKERYQKTLRNVLRILCNTQNRVPFFGCYGLHEWAMLYDTSHSNPMQLSSKFQKLPLRLSLHDIANVVQTHRPRCTHFDAIRFFPEEAAALNTVQPLPTRDTSPFYEQPGCIHVNMDLLK